MSLPLALSVTPETVTFTAALAATGFSTSFLGGILGAGSGLVLIPILQYLFTMFGLSSDAAMELTVGTTSFSMIFSSAMSTRREINKGLIEWAAMKQWIVPVLLGVAATHMLGLATGYMMKLVFAAVMVLLSVYMLAGKEHWRLADRVPLGPKWMAVGFVFGFVCSLAGVGGAILAIPLLVSCGVPLARAMSSCVVLGLMIGIPSTFYYIQMPTINAPFTLGYINFLAAAVLFVTGQYGRPLGLWVQARMSPELLRKVFAALLVVSATRICLSLA